MIAEQQPFSRGWEGRSWYCRCFAEVVAIRFHDPEPICMSYEAWFTLSGNIPYILGSNPHPFYSFRGLKNQMRIRVACRLDSRLWAGFWKNDRATVCAV